MHRFLYRFCAFLTSTLLPFCVKIDPGGRRSRKCRPSISEQLSTHFYTVLDLGACPKVAKINVRTASANPCIFLYFLLTKRTPKWTPKGTISEAKCNKKNQHKLKRKNTPKRNRKGAQMMPKWYPTIDQKTLKNSPLGLQGALGDSSGSPGVPPGAPDAKMIPKCDQNCGK